MKAFYLIFLVFFFVSCSNSQVSKNVLSAKEFSEKIKSTEKAQLIDVRTAEEYSEGHLLDSKNYNWNGDIFDKQSATLDKEKAVFVYCKSGRRSAAAAEHLRSKGFKTVYELEGGITNWRENKLPESK
ncbi:MAG: rhodanese-like domain-containing protein [Bacteroidota bacterium]